MTPGAALVLTALTALSALAADTAPPAPSSGSAVILVHLYRCDPVAFRQLFRDGVGARTGHLAADDFTVEEVHLRIARVAEVDAFALRYASTVQLFKSGDGITALATPGGDGVALRIERRAAALDLAVCELSAGRARRHLVDLRLGPGDIVLLGLRLEGEPVVAALRGDLVPLGAEARYGRPPRVPTTDTRAAGALGALLGYRPAPADAERCLASPH